MADFNILNFISSNQNYVIIGVIIIGAFVIYEYFLKGEKKPPKPVDRAEVERKKFIERNRLNLSNWSWLMRGNQIVGKIIMMMDEKLKGSEEHDVLEMVVKPALFGKFTIANPFADEICIQVDAKNTDYNKTNPTKFLRILQEVTFSNVFGIFYDRTIEPVLVEHIKNDDVFRTDLENFSAIYYAKSQEQATFDPERAFQIHKAQIELEKEKEKRSQKLDTV